MLYFVAFIAQFFNVFLRAFQQKNVMKDKYLWVFPTSYLMAAAEYASWGAVIHSILKDGNPLLTITALGFGGGSGCVLSMFIHNKMSKQKVMRASPLIPKTQ